MNHPVELRCLYINVSISVVDDMLAPLTLFITISAVEAASYCDDRITPYDIISVPLSSHVMTLFSRFTRRDTNSKKYTPKNVNLSLMCNSLHENYLGKCSSR